MKEEFTPGPWKIDINSVQTAINTKDNEKHIAMVNYNQKYMNEHEHIANAKLIASAPELFFILKEALDEEEAYEAGERVYGKWIKKAKIILEKIKN